MFRGVAGLPDRSPFAGDDAMMHIRTKLLPSSFRNFVQEVTAL
jgi:hypothetical protein